MSELNLQVPFVKLSLDDDADLVEDVKNILTIARPNWTRADIKCEVVSLFLR